MAKTPRITKKIKQRSASLCTLANIDECDQAFVEAGLAYGYPECCVVFFAKVWHPLVTSLMVTNDGEERFLEENEMTENQLNLAEAWTGYFDWMEYLDLKHEHYIPCPACALKARRATLG